MGGDRGSKGDFGRGIGETTHFARRVTDGKTIMEKTTDNGGIGDDYSFSPSPWKKIEDLGRVWGGKKRNC